MDFLQLQPVWLWVGPLLRQPFLSLMLPCATHRARTFYVKQYIQNVDSNKDKFIKHTVYMVLCNLVFRLKFGVTRQHPFPWFIHFTQLFKGYSGRSDDHF